MASRTALRMSALFPLLFFLFCLPHQASAKDAYALKTGKGCVFCHLENTGGQLKTVGFAYIRNGYNYPIPRRVLEKAENLQRPFHKTLRFILGYIHLLAAVVFFGAIFYVHIFIKPSRLTGGIPKPERRLGVSCMVILALSGIYLTWMRIDRWEQFFNNTFGFMLLVKIVLFLLMVAVGITAITVVHRRMAAQSKAPLPEGDVSPDTIGHYDGADGRAARIIHEGVMYDVTSSPLWKDGRHFGKHRAGADLTEALGGAPHGPEVLQRVKALGGVSPSVPATPHAPPVQRIFTMMANTNLFLVFLILACISVWRWDFPVRLLPETRGEALAGERCIACHQENTPGIFRDWQASVHGKAGVNCNTCHRPMTESATLASHLANISEPVSVVVSPRNCAGCHPKQGEEYARSKHANTQEIIWRIDSWLNDGMNNAVERTTGCYACHGTRVAVHDGKPVEGTWPNVGVGRINPDGSKGSCSSCHTRHRFSIAEARKPEACDQCHLGPDHPQIEIYNESKHGTIYHSEGDTWSWGDETLEWKAGEHFRAPTCAACHMSAAGAVSATHDVTERLSWETQAPRTVRPQDFAPFPAATDWREERAKMKTVCMQCHASTWTDDHFRNLDNVITNYNEGYFDPMKQLVDELRDSGHLAGAPAFDEEIEWQFYELWHHEGRRARMGAAMMAPDYAWWHGFYELKHRSLHLERLAEELKKGKGPALYPRFPGRMRE